MTIFQIPEIFLVLVQMKMFSLSTINYLVNHFYENVDVSKLKFESIVCKSFNFNKDHSSMIMDLEDIK